MLTEDNAELSRAIYELFNDNEFGRALEYVAEDAEAELYPDGLSFRGREGFREKMAYHETPFPDGAVEVLRQLTSEEGVTYEGIYRATGAARREHARNARIQRPKRLGAAGDSIRRRVGGGRIRASQAKRDGFRRPARVG